MQATTAVCDAGGKGRSPLSKPAAYCSELATKASVLLTVPPRRRMFGYRRDRIHLHVNLILTCQTRNTGLTSAFTGAQLIRRGGWLSSCRVGGWRSRAAAAGWRRGLTWISLRSHDGFQRPGTPRSPLQEASY